MSITRFLLSIMMLLIFITACGSDDDDGGGSVDTTVQQETACPDPTETSNIRTLLNNLSNSGTIEGIATEQIFNEDGSSTLGTSRDATYDFDQEDVNSWITIGNGCNQNGACSRSETTTALRDGCFFYDDLQANVNTATMDTLNLTVDGVVDGIPGVRNAIVSIASNGVVTISEDISQNGRTARSFRFISDTGEAGNTAGGTGTTTGGTTTGGTTTGGTTTGEAPDGPFEVPNHNCPAELPVCPAGFNPQCEWEIFEDGSRVYQGMCIPEGTN